LLNSDPDPDQTKICDDKTIKNLQLEIFLIKTIIYAIFNPYKGSSGSLYIEFLNFVLLFRRGEPFWPAWIRIRIPQSRPADPIRIRNALLDSTVSTHKLKKPLLG
jgi:hypothetical protein